MTYEHAIDVEVVDDDFAPPEAVHTEHGPVVDCPACHKPFKKHSSFELLHCAEDGDYEDADALEVENPEYEAWQVQRKARREGWEPAEDGTWMQPVAPAPAPGDYGRVPPPSPEFVRFERVVRQVITAEPPGIAAPDPVPEPEFTGAEVRAGALDTASKVVRLPNGEIDLEGLALTMRDIIERERDEVIRRGGPLEKQNQDLKMRLADALEEAARWRTRHHAAVEARNAFETQLKEAQANIRRIKAGKAEVKNGHGNATSVKDILKVVESTKGFEVRRKGNGHFGIYKEGIFVVDMAGSPGQEQANLNTRVTLRKAGLRV